MKRRADEEVQYATELYVLCREFHVLPRAGGLLDQDYRDVLYLKHAAAAYAEKAELDTKRATK